MAASTERCNGRGAVEAMRQQGIEAMGIGALGNKARSDEGFEACGVRVGEYRKAGAAQAAWIA